MLATKLVNRVVVILFFFILATVTLQAQRPPKKKIHYSTMTEITPFYGGQFFGQLILRLVLFRTLIRIKNGQCRFSCFRWQ